MIKFNKCFLEFISNFGDLINQLKEKNIEIMINLKKNDSNSKIKYLNLELKKNDKIFISKDIYAINVNYYLTKGINHERINSIPFGSIIQKEYFNIKDILELIGDENILNNYDIDFIRYFNEEKGAFQLMNNEKIPTKEKNIFEINIKKANNPFMKNLNLIQKYFKEEIIKIKNSINKISEKVQKYDLIYLYASPIVDEIFEESDSSISYLSEIRLILELMKNSGKKFNCKLECADEKILRDIIQNKRTKILHISSHGYYDKTYYLALENLKNGQIQKINYNKLKFILNGYKANINKIDLVFVSTCYSQDLEELFFNCGAKNVIFIQRKAKIVDRVIMKFTQNFYQNLIQGNNIKKSYEMSIDSMKNDKEILNMNYNSCCCNHFHHEKTHCNNEKDILHGVHIKKSEDCICKCNNIHPNYHDKNCKYYQILKNIIIKTKKSFIKEQKDNTTIYYTQKSIDNFNCNSNDKIDVNQDKNIFIKEDKDKNIICCCDVGIEHSEILKIMFRSKNEEYIDLSIFNFNEKGKLSINSSIKFYFNEKKFTSTLGRKHLMSKILNHITKNGNFIFLYGEKV